MQEQQVLIDELKAQLQQTQHTNAGLKASNEANALRLERVEALLEIGIRAEE